jgi:hypothetical protein
VTNSSQSASKPKTSRARGVKPSDPTQREQRVAEAVRDLERIGAAFTIADIAERAGISRATIYRTPALRDMIGAKGDCARPVDQEIHARLTAKHDALKKRSRELRRQLSDLEQSWNEVRERAVTAERRLQAAERQISLLAGSRNGSGSAHNTLAKAAERLSPEEVRQARRLIAAVLHPDLFAKNPAAAALATELLKSLNALTE